LSAWTANRANNWDGEKFLVATLLMKFPSRIFHRNYGDYGAVIQHNLILPNLATAGRSVICIL